MTPQKTDLLKQVGFFLCCHYEITISEKHCSTTGSKQQGNSLLETGRLVFASGGGIIVLVSTAFFALLGVENWRIPALVWALIPLGNMAAFTRVPIAPLIEVAKMLFQSSYSFAHLAGSLFLLSILCVLCCPRFL